MSLDHDGIFKQLLSAFLVEFLDLFAPDLLALLDPQDLTLLPTESFVNLLDPHRRTADLLVHAQIRGSPGAILIHLEHQAQADAQLDRRMFRYFARFYDRAPHHAHMHPRCNRVEPRRMF
jgi:predicted transposase/invertase (TIGR01784 family)